MRLPRSTGILLHVSSLPGRFGIGDLGEPALKFVDWLRDAGASYWQILPLGPSDDGNPYVAQSSWAGSQFLVSLDELARAGDLTPDEMEAAVVPHASRVDFVAVGRTRERLLRIAASRFFGRGGAERERYERFCAEEAAWLEDWAMFAAARRAFDFRPWWEWPRDQALHTPAGLVELAARQAAAIKVEKYVQFRFFEQWGKVRRKAADAGIGLIGDIPFYAARDSADIWAAPDHFLLDSTGTPLVVSGAPPDYFSAEGQRWGTPVYRWERHAGTGYRWWISRMRGALKQADVVRIDHFRAFESYWEIDNDKPAKAGRWVKGPGDALFAAARDALGQAPFIAEDLGMITKPVRELRDRWELPGMRVLQFAFLEGAASPHLPIWYPRNCIAYTGTHDNDTTVGWYEKATEKEKDMFRRWTSTDGGYSHFHLTRVAFASVADLAVVPMQDVLGLGSEARMNVPGVAKGNWGWKLTPDQVHARGAATMRDLAELFGRLPGQRQAIDE